MSKDTISVNMNIYDIPILVEQLEKANKENERLKEEYVMLQNASDEVEEELQQRIDKAIEYIKEKEYVDYNPTLDGSEDDSYMKLPRSLSLYNEELDILLDILERK